MAGRGKSTQQSRTEAERARLHTARKTWHEGQIRRRIRDNAVASVGAALVIAGAIASQVVLAQTRPPEEPAPTPTVEPTTAPVPNETPLPEPLPSDTPAE